MNRILIIIVAVLIVGGAICFKDWQSFREAHVQTINDILAKEELMKSVEVDYLYMPVTVGQMVIAPQVYAGYFTVKKRTGKPMVLDNCKLETFDYTGKMLGDQFVLAIDGPTVMRISACSI